MQRSRVRKAWAAAIAVSLLVHVLILAVFFRDWTPRAPAFREDAIEVSLVRPEPTRSEAQRAPSEPLPRAREPAALAPSTVAPFVATTAEGPRDPPPPRPAAAPAVRGAPDESLSKLAAPDPRRKDCRDAAIAELFGPRLRECEYIIEEARAKSAVPLPAGPLPPPLPDSGLDPRALAEFDKGRAMRNCVVPHPQGGCLKDKGVIFKRKF